MPYFDLNTALWLAMLICLTFALAAVLLRNGLGSKTLADRLLVANFAMAGVLLYRILSIDSVPNLGYSFMWSLWMVAALVFVSALRLMSEQAEGRPALTVTLLVSMAALWIAASAFDKPHYVAIVASICVAWASAVGVVSSWRIPVSGVAPVRLWLMGSFAAGCLATLVHLPMRVSELLQGKQAMAHSGLTYAGLLLIWVSVNVGLMLLVQMRLVARVEAQALQDELTGAMNRRGLAVRLAERRARVAPASPPAGAIVLVDIDHFKRVNDHWGHDTGDRILRWFCIQMRTFVRGEDILVRLGGEEFAVFLANCSVQDAQTRAEQMCHWFGEQARFDRDGEPTRVTASFGVVAFSGLESDLKDDLIRADEAMYAAKHAGRATVRRWRPADVRPVTPFGSEQEPAPLMV